MRRSIKIESVSEIDPRTSTEPTVLHHFRDEIAAAGGPVTVAAAEEEELRLSAQLQTGFIVHCSAHS